MTICPRIHGIDDLAENSRKREPGTETLPKTVQNALTKSTTNTVSVVSTYVYVHADLSSPIAI